MTFQTALKILGRAGTPGIDKLDATLGGLILAAGAGAVVAAVGGAALAPAGAIAALWGWVDQKSEAVNLLRRVVGRLSPTIDGATGREQRQQLIAAAHTAIVAAAFFEELRHRQVTAPLTGDDQRSLIGGSREHERDRLLEGLYRTEVPAPGPDRGFAENLGPVRGWMAELGDRTQRLLSGLDGHRMFDVYELAEDATQRYRSHYIDLAAAVPEFQAWSHLGEHAATRRRIDALGARIDEGRHQVSESLEAANRARPRARVVPGGVDRDATALTFPRIEELFVEPGYRLCAVSDGTRAGDENWWSDLPERDDLLARLEVHAASETELPMLILGHPGAGKSMLTKVLAAHLSARGCTVAWVPLRAVSAHAPVLDQIEEGLRLATNQGIAWAGLPRGRRVVMLDGLDELLQASPSDRSGYLQEVADFQRREEELGRPVSVLVTSRTVVADRVRTPRELTVAKLDDFDEGRTAQWLRRWNAANEAGIASGNVRRVALETVLHQRHLASQPLLLLMLTIYAADPVTPPLDEGMKITDLYEQLIQTFARREAAKKTRSGDDETTATTIERLSVAALAMFNRGRQYVTEAELGTDLAALSGTDAPPQRPEVTGQRLLAEFFFVHAAEATGLDRTERVYEFLHATFGEYLIARRVVEELRDIVDGLGERRRREPDDGLLRALLSYQALAVRRPIEQFASEIIAGLGERDRADVADVLETLIRRFRQDGKGHGHPGYRPAGTDHLREMAAYSANLFLLRLACEPAGGQVSLLNLLPELVEFHWRQTVMLWRCGLDSEGWQAVLGLVGLVDPATITRGPGPVIGSGFLEEMSYYQLIGDADAQESYAIGSAIHDGLGWAAPDWPTRMRTWLVGAAAGYGTLWVVHPPPPDTDPDQISEIYDLMARVVVHSARNRPVQALADLVCLLAVSTEHRLSVATAVCRHATLLDAAKALGEPSLYSEIPMAAMMDATRPARPSESWLKLRESLPDPGPGDASRAVGLLITA